MQSVNPRILSDLQDIIQSSSVQEAVDQMLQYIQAMTKVLSNAAVATKLGISGQDITDLGVVQTDLAAAFVVADKETVTVAAQVGTLSHTSGGSATFAVTSTSVIGSQGSIGWFTTVGGTTPTTAPAGLTIAVSQINLNGGATVTLSAVPGAVSAASYYFKLTEDLATSAVGTLTVTA